ncbi:MAG TPA: cupin domain-containing protein [Herpetosiphonaceae bacterium]|nr:cupin domain-containing protein [Herpetosiphonaceae bacterium]
MIVRATDLSPIESPGGNATAGIATPGRGAGQVSLIRQRQAPGGQNPLHRHDREEVMLVAAGRVSLTVGETSAELAAGDAAIIPAETLHQVRNSGDEPAEWLLIAPGGIRYFGADGQEMQPAWAK